MISAIWMPIVGSIAAGATTTLEKLVLKIKETNPKTYLTSIFFTTTVLMIPILFFLWKMEAEAFSLTNILIFLIVVAFSIASNSLMVYAMKWEKITTLEPVRLLEPLFTIILAIIFSFIFGEALYERNTKVIIPAIIAGVALVFSHIKKHHLSFNKYFVAAIFGGVFFSFELVTSKLILGYYSPISFYFIRCLLIFVSCLIIFRPKFGALGKKVKWKIFATATLWIVYRLMVYYGYITLGIIFTTLIFMLGPIFIYLFAWKFLKEKPDWRNLVAAAVILASVLYVILT